MIRLVDLTVGYKTKGKPGPVIHVDGLSAPAGQLVAIIGLNGIGKSTLMKTMAGVLPALSGQVLYDSKPVSVFSRLERAQFVTYIGTGSHLDDQFTVAELVSLGRHPHTNWFGSLTKNDWDIVNRAVESVGLTALASKPVLKISDGERQRAHIARALAQDSPVILLDEPTAFLDVVNRYTITWLLKDLCELHGKTIIFSTHDWSVALQIAHKIWLLLPGECREGAPEDLALNGDVEALLNQSSLTFDLYTGRITNKRKKNGQIRLKLGDADYKWASSAMERIGFQVTDDSRLLLSRSETGLWSLNTDENRNLEFQSLYELIDYLRSTTVCNI